MGRQTMPILIVTEKMLRRVLSHLNILPSHPEPPSLQRHSSKRLRLNLPNPFRHRDKLLAYLLSASPPRSRTLASICWGTKELLLSLNPTTRTIDTALKRRSRRFQRQRRSHMNHLASKSNNRISMTTILLLHRLRVSPSSRRSLTRVDTPLLLTIRLHTTPLIASEARIRTATMGIIVSSRHNT